MSEKRLHPAAILFQFIKSLKDMALGLLPIIVISFNGDTLWYAVIGAAVLVVLLSLMAFVKWLRFSYLITEDELQIKQGIVIRKERRISKNRIQSIDLTQSLIHRIFGLTKVQIETAGSDENVDASLSAVLFSEGERVQSELKTGKRTSLEDEEEVEKEYPSETLGYGRLALTGATSDNAIIILGLMWLLYSQANQIIPDEVYEQVTTWVLSLAIQVLVFFLLLSVFIVWGAGVLWTIVKYGNFTITRYDKELYMTYGLLEKRQRTIPVHRIQAVIVKENLIRQLFGLCYVYVEVAGGVSGGRMEEGTVYMLPLLKKKRVPAFLEMYLPEYYREEPGIKRPPLAAIPYYVWKGALVSIIAVIAVFYFSPSWIAVPLVAVPIFLSWGLFRWQTAGIAVDDPYLNLRFRKISRETVTLQKRRLQAFEKNENWLYKRQQLATIDVAILNNTAGRHFIVSALKEKDVTEASAQFSSVPHIHTSEQER
ncbi:putative membrane protein [Salimicrobium halophilum]|uniref:Putative membrane protein n=2 Tax=Salimicrobium halophilum TaxID=86666 RepID=A0A1G8TW28_9BACI|nr:putative membrane protein [Salimicrobium halophilum]